MVGNKISAGRKRRRRMDNRLACPVLGVILVFIGSLFLWLIAFLPTFSPVWLVIGCTLLGGFAGTLRFAKRDGWRGFMLILSLFCYTLFTRFALVDRWPGPGFLGLTLIFAVAWLLSLAAPSLVRSMEDFLKSSRLLWVRIYRKVAWLGFLIIILLIMYIFRPASETQSSYGIFFYGWGVVSAFLSASIRRPAST